MKAVILAAGRGTRMGQSTMDKPKCMLEFLGKTLLERQIEIFRSMGLSEIMIVTGYRSEKIDCPGCIKVRNNDYATTNMVESLFCTRDYWTDTIIVSYGDIVYEKSVLQKLIDSAKDLNAVVDLNGLTYFKERFGQGFLSKAESLVLDGDGYIIDIGEPNPGISRVQGQYIGLMKFSKKGLNALSKAYDEDRERYWDKPWLRSKNFQNAYMTDMLQHLINLGHKVYSVGINGGWLEFDSSSDYDKYMEWLRQGNLGRYFMVPAGESSRRES